MMKRKYIAPETFQTACYGDVVMGAASPNSGREAGGDPTNNGLSPGIEDYTGQDGQNPFTNGQGDDGTGNRGKEFDLWDIGSFDVWD